MIVSFSTTQEVVRLGYVAKVLYLRLSKPLHVVGVIVWAYFTWGREVSRCLLDQVPANMMKRGSPQTTDCKILC